MSALVDQSLARPQSLSLLVTSFAAVALLLSVIGIYGVMGYYVQQHLKEISIRMALGGSQADVARLVLGQGMTVVGIGIAVGIAVALGATRLMSSLLFNVGASDPSAYMSAGLLLFAVAVLACAVPAFRAMRLQPAAVLRNEIERVPRVPRAWTPTPLARKRLGLRDRAFPVHEYSPQDFS